MENIDKVLEHLGVMKEGDSTILCGAGISWNSGLPLADHLIKYFLEKMEADTHLFSQAIKQVHLPFEAFMEIVLGFSSDLSVLNLFLDGEPNLNHLFCAHLARKGYVNSIFTTNFDMLIERALTRLDQPFQVFFREVDFIPENLRVDGIKVYKIHGSAHDKMSIRTTLRMVAHRTFNEKRRAIIEYCFSSPKTGSRVLILGYSCSDLFDIIPLIQNIHGSRKKIILVEHSQCEAEIDDIIKKKEPFADFNGEWIRCRTDDLVKELWNRFDLGKYPACTLTPLLWKKHIDKWAAQLSPEIRSFILGYLAYNVSLTDQALEFYRQSLQLYQEADNISLQLETMAQMAMVYRAQERNDRALECLSRACELSDSYPDVKGASDCYIKMGSLLMAMKEYDLSLEYLNKAIDRKANTKDSYKNCRLYLELGSLAIFRKSYPEALRYFKASLEASLSSGDLAIEARSLHQIGVVYQAMNSWHEALSHYRNALDLKEKIGDSESAGNTYYQMGTVYQATKEFALALRSYQWALEMFRRTSNLKAQSDAHRWIGGIYNLMQDQERALHHCYESLSLSEKISHRSNQSFALNFIGIAHLSINEVEKAVKHFQASLTIAIAENYRILICKNYCDLGRAENLRNDYTKAIEYYKKCLAETKDTTEAPWIDESLQELIRLNIDLGNYDDALDHLKKVENMAIKQEDPLRLGYVYSHRAQIFEKNEDYKSALINAASAYLIALRSGWEKQRLEMLRTILKLKTNISREPFFEILCEYGLRATESDKDVQFFRKFCHSIKKDGKASYQERECVISSLKDMIEEEQVEESKEFFRMCKSYLENKDISSFKETISPQLYLMFQKTEVPDL